jgi:protein-disulfide isomerase
VPVAYFSDARCVYCQVLSPLLHDLERREPIPITWHELPLLGAASRSAAKAALAARRQGAYAIFHDRLMGTPFMPNTAYVRQIALDAGVDVEQLLRDMQGADVADTIERTGGLARRFGFYGTPALVVGRTAVLGNIDERKLRRLIEIEVNMTDPGPCS